MLRQLRLRDAPSLLHHVNATPVLQFIAPCPTTIEGFERFIRWTHVERLRGRHACYGIVPGPTSAAVGIIQLWSVEREFSTAEWGFAIGTSFWGTGVFTRSAHLFLDAVFVDAVFGSAGVYRLEARAVADNRRGNAVLRKLGATPILLPINETTAALNTHKISGATLPPVGAGRLWFWTLRHEPLHDQFGRRTDGAGDEPREVREPASAGAIHHPQIQRPMAG
jgi:RimJ/RimL family protein N-acetyltransferase